MKVTKFDQLVKHLTEMSFTPWEVEDDKYDETARRTFEAAALRDFVLDERDEKKKNRWLSLLGVTDVDSADEWYDARGKTGQEGFDDIGFEEHLRMVREKPDEYPLQNT
jgi:hypothetical protein